MDAGFNSIDITTTAPFSGKINNYAVSRVPAGELTCRAGLGPMSELFKT